MVIVLVVVHVILNVSLTIDHPEVSQIGAPETEMIDFRIGVGFFDGIFHFDHGFPPAWLVKTVPVVPIVPNVSVVQNPGSFVIPRRPFFGLDQASMSAVAIGMILRSPAAADSDGRRLVEFQDVRSYVCDYV